MHDTQVNEAAECGATVLESTWWEMRLKAAAKCRESHMVRRGWRSDGLAREVIEALLASPTRRGGWCQTTVKFVQTSFFLPKLPVFFFSSDFLVFFSSVFFFNPSVAFTRVVLFSQVCMCVRFFFQQKNSSGWRDAHGGRRCNFLGAIHFTWVWWIMFLEYGG